MLTGREAVVRAAGERAGAAGDVAYARFAVAMAEDVRGVCGRDAVLWWGQTGFGLTGHGVGAVSTLDELVARERGAGRLDGVAWINLPRRTAAPPGFALREDWDFRWLTGPVRHQPGQDDVVALDPGAETAVDALLDLAMPSAAVRPGHVLAHRWYGVWAGHTLVACGADRSARPAQPGAERVGVVGSIAVHPGHRRRGLGAAVSAELSRRLQADHDLVTLGVATGNDNASRVYERLGYTGSHELTSVRPA